MCTAKWARQTYGRYKLMTFAMSDSGRVALKKHKTGIEAEIEALVWGNNRYTTSAYFSGHGGPRDTSVPGRARTGDVGFRRFENLVERNSDRRRLPWTQ
jgi:hypothetical protein